MFGRKMGLVVFLTAGAALAGGCGSSGTKAAATVAETPGGEVHTWTNYETAGGTPGPVLPGYTTVAIACRLHGLKVSDGNTWWYRIAQAPSNGKFYGSADAFYNNGHTSGSLHGTPFFDPKVPVCSS